MPDVNKLGFRAAVLPRVLLNGLTSSAYFATLALSASPAAARSALGLGTAALEDAAKINSPTQVFLNGYVPTGGEKLGVRIDQTGFASNTLYKAGGVTFNINPSSDSDGTPATFTDYAGFYAQNIIPVGSTKMVGKTRGLASYVFNKGNGPGWAHFGGTIEYFNDRNAQLTQAAGALIGVFNNKELNGASGYMALGIGASIIASNERNAGIGIGTAYGAYSRVENVNGGTITTATATSGDINNYGTSRIDVGYGFSTDVTNSGSGSIGTAAGLRTRAANPAGVITNFFHIWGRPHSGVAPVNNYFVYDESGAPSYTIGKWGFNVGTPRSVLHVVNAENGGIGAQILLTTTMANATAKYAGIDMPHYLAAEEDVRLIYADVGPTNSSIRIGGGSGLFNAATQIDMITAANNVTTVGSVTLRLSAGGEVRFPSLTTTASAANAFLDSADNNRLLRSTSSKRYKTKIAPLKLDKALGIVMAARPVEFEEKAKRGPRHIGLIAEQEAEHAPQLIHFVNDEPDGVQYDRYVAPLLAVAAAHERRIAALEGKRA